MRHSRRLRTAPGSLVGVVVAHLPENSRYFLLPFSQNSIVHCGGGICVGVLYIRCLNMSVPHVARELCMSILCMIHIYAYLCNGLVVLHKAD